MEIYFVVLFHLLFCGWNTLEIIIMVHSLFLVGIFSLTLYKRMLVFKEIPYTVHFTQ